MKPKFCNYGAIENKMTNNTQLTVLEVVKKYRLENTDKHYVDQDGKNHDTSISLNVLKDMKVSQVMIDPAHDKALIIIKTKES